MRSNLLCRGLDIDVTCPMFSSAPETLLHLLKDCSYSILFWALAPVSNNLITSDLIDFRSWFQNFRKKATGDQLENFICLCWCLSTNMNRKVHEDKVYDAQDSSQYVRRYIAAFKAAITEFSSPRPPDTTAVWVSPAPGITKLNFDASVRPSIRGAGVGIVARNNKREVLAWRRIHLDFIQDLELAETMTAKSVV